MPVIAQISTRAETHPSKGHTAISAARQQASRISAGAASKRATVGIAKPQAAEFALRERLHRLALLFHRRWTPPLLAELLRGDTGAGGAKFITLANRLKIINGGRAVSRESIKATLDELIKHDYVMRNPGYGHPMRPEYLLAEAGYDIALHCRTLLSKLHSMHLTGLVQRKWALPTTFAIGSGLARFGEMKAALPKITARALTLALKELLEQGAIEREIVESFPPSTRYRLARTARSLMPTLVDMACDRGAQ